MTELETMQRAKMYMDKLAQGIDPITDRELPEDSALNNVRLARCFFYVSDVLGQVIVMSVEATGERTFFHYRGAAVQGADLSGARSGDTAGGNDRHGGGQSADEEAQHHGNHKLAAGKGLSGKTDHPGRQEQTGAHCQRPDDRAVYGNPAGAVRRIPGGIL